MKQSEFDRFAEHYLEIHANNIRASGETPDFFAECKIRDVAGQVAGRITAEHVLDFGAGVGNLIPHLKNHFTDATISCLDVSERSLAIAQERHPQAAHCILFDGKRMPFTTNSFDISIAACVFHHIDAQFHNSLLSEVMRVTKPGGWLFIFEHNPYNPLTRNAVNNCPFDKNAKLISGRYLRSHLKKLNLDQIKLRYQIFFPGFLSGMRSLEPKLSWLPLGAQYVVSGRKINEAPKSV